MRANFVRDLLFPPKCPSCHTLLDWQALDQSGTAGTEALCHTCLAEWESEELETCGICTERVKDCRCMTERMQKAKCLGFGKLVYYVPGESKLAQSRVIYLIKRRNHERTLSFLAERLVELAEQIIKTEGWQREDVLITYLPRTKKARLQHGVDQAEELAKRMAAQSGIAMRPLLCRTPRSREQKKLSPEQRIQNARYSFDLMTNVDCKGKWILLVDDIVTTGNGMARGTRLLRRAGCAGVYGLAVASNVYNKERH